MDKEPIPTGIQSNNETQVTFSEIFNNFSKTEAGKKLFENIRYERYNLGNKTNTEWEKLLGADVNNLKHLLLTYGLTRQFIKHLSDNKEKNKLTKEEQENLLLAATIHDFAEAVVGDHSYDLKTKEVEERELEELRKMTESMYGKENPELLSRTNVVVKSVIEDPETKLGKMFNAVERIGYVRTGLNAWKQSKEIQGDTKLKTGLQWITGNVFSGQISKLVEYSELYPPVELYLKENKDLISEVFNNLSFDTFAEYEPKEKEAQLKTAKQDWENYYQKISLEN